MTTRLLIAYLLLAMLLAGGVFAVWWLVRNTERNVRRRERRQRRQRYKAEQALQQRGEDGSPI